MDRDPAFDRQLQTMFKPLTSFAMRLCQDRVKAEDMVQSTMAKALENYTSFQLGTNMKSWLYTIMKNDYFSVMRKKKREVEDVDGIFSLMQSTPENQSASVDLKTIHSRMKRLPMDIRACIQMVGVLGMEYEEVAEQLKIPIGTVKSRVSRARIFLETGITDQFEEPEIDMPPPPAVSDVDRIRDLYKAGKSVTEIAADMGGMKKSKVMSILASNNIRR